MGKKIKPAAPKLHAQRMIGFMDRVDNHGTSLCNMCPYCRDWKQLGNYIKWATDEGCLDTKKACIQCRDFISPHKMDGCPCLVLGHNTAYELAHRAIGQWKRGKHKWQK